jgi:hypothetical protein
VADGEITESRDEERVPRADGVEPEISMQPCAEIRVELWDSLPGDRAVIGVEQDGQFVWIASRRYVDPKAVEEFADQLGRIVKEGWWVQNWPGVPTR